MYYPFSFSVRTVVSHLDPVTFFYLYWTKKKQKTQKREVTTANCTRVKCVLLSATRCWWMYELYEACSLPFILVPLIKVVRICWADDWFNDDDQLESQPDRYSVLFTVSIRDNQNITRDTTRPPKYLEPTSPHEPARRFDRIKTDCAKFQLRCGWIDRERIHHL